eukprot:tig00000711_g3411.t1
MELIRVRSEPTCSLRGQLPLRLRLPSGKPQHYGFVSDLAVVFGCSPKELQALATKAGHRPVVAKLEGAPDAAAAGGAAAPQLALAWPASYALALLKMHKAEEDAAAAAERSGALAVPAGAPGRPGPPPPSACATPRPAFAPPDPGRRPAQAAAGSPPPGAAPAPGWGPPGPAAGAAAGAAAVPAAGPGPGPAGELPEPLVHRALTLEERLTAERLMAKLGARGHNLHDQLKDAEARCLVGRHTMDRLRKAQQTGNLAVHSGNTVFFKGAGGRARAKEARRNIEYFEARLRAAEEEALRARP